MLRTYAQNARSGVVEVELETGQTLSGTVAWATEWEIGLAFPAPVEVDAILAQCTREDPVEERRTSPRTQVTCPAQLRLPTRVLKGHLTDISGGGASVETLRPMDIGTCLILTLPDLPPLRACVRWSSGNSSGLEFDEALPPDVLDGWLDRRLLRREEQSTYV